MAAVQNKTNPTLLYDFGSVIPQRNESGVNNDTFNYKCMFPIEHGIPIVIINIIFSILGTFGNFLIIMVVLKTPKLRRVSNFLLLSLAVADLLVTMVAQPMQVTTVAAKTFGHFCIPQVDFTYDIMANFSCSCSLFHLAAISIDRAIVIAKPHDYQSIMKKGLRALIGGCWGIALLFVSLRVPFPETLFLSVAMIFSSYFTIIVSYTIILFQITRERVSRHKQEGYSRKVSRNVRMERRVAGTIAIVILVFSICWFPLVGFYVSMKKGLLRTIVGIPYMWIRTILLLNSSMNFLIYSFRIDHFRSAYRKMIYRWVQRSRAWLTSKSAGTTSSMGGTLSSSKYSASVDKVATDI